MKKNYLFQLLFLICCAVTKGQTSAYTFLQTNGTYTPITGGSLLGGATNDEQYFTDASNLAGSTTATGGVGFPIGFNFTFNGDVFDRIGIQTNGWISFGHSSLSPAVNMGVTGASVYNPISNSTAISPAKLRNRVAGMGGDLQGQTGSSMRIQTIGTAPYRVLVVQWTNFRHFNLAGDVLNFQIQLHETFNKVSIVYGSNSYTSSVSNPYEVGLTGQSNADFNNRGTAPYNGNWNESFPGSSNSTVCFINMGAVMPVSGLTFTWGMAVPCSGTPVAGAVTPTALSLCSGATVGSLKVNGISEFTTGLTYQWEQSNDNFATAPINAVGGTGANTIAYTPPVFAGTNIYYRLKIMCTNSGLTGYSAVIPVTVNSAPTTQTTNVTVSVPFTTATLNWTNGNGSRRMVVFSNAPIVPPTNGTANALTQNTVYSGTGQQIVYDGTASTVKVSGLTLSSVYYVGVFEYNSCPNGAQLDYYYNTSTATNLKVFGTTPTNDSCFGPTVLNPSGNFNSGAIVGTLFNASSTSGNPIPNFPSCQTQAGYDVWYTVVIPASGRITIETQVNDTNSLTDSVLGVFSGADCFGLTEIACDDNSGPAGVNDLMAIKTISNRTPGEKIFIGVWNRNTLPTLTNCMFKIAAYDATLSNDSFEDAAFDHYPNPVYDVLNLSYNKTIEKVVFYNLLGQEVLEKSINSMQTKIDVSSLMQGTYLVKVLAEGGSKVLKVVKE